MEEDRVEGRPEHVVLALVVGTVADPHGAGTVVPAHVVERGFREVPAAVDPVHDLQAAVVVRLEVGDELHELVGFPVEVQPVQRLQRERRVADPAVPVVPVALATRRLGQACRERGDGGTCRHVRQALDGECRALDRVAVPMIRDARPIQPPSPEIHRRRDAPIGVGGVSRSREIRRPRQRAKEAITGLHDVTAAHAIALHADAEIRVEPQRDVAAGCFGDMALVVDDAPRRRHPPVVEHGLADDLHLHATD